MTAPDQGEVAHGDVYLDHHDGRRRDELDQYSGLVRQRRLDPTGQSFKMAPGNDFLIHSSNLFTIGAGGTASPDTANSVTMTGQAAKLIMAPGGAFDIATTLTLDSLLNLGTTTASTPVLTW